MTSSPIDSWYGRSNVLNTHDVLITFSRVLGVFSSLEIYVPNQIVQMYLLILVLTRTGQMNKQYKVGTRCKPQIYGVRILHLKSI